MNLHQTAKRTGENRWTVAGQATLDGHSPQMQKPEDCTL
jgi:hypothetical protein